MQRIGYISRNASPLCHFRANACGVQSNPEGAPAGGISALVQGVIPNAYHPPVGREASPSKNHLPSKPKTSPISPPLLKYETKFHFVSGGDMGEVFVGLGGGDFLQGAASRLIGERGAFRYNAIHECRDSACWRPCGVRLRGSSSFYRLIFNICAAPLRMT